MNEWTTINNQNDNSCITYYQPKAFYFTGVNLERIQLLRELRELREIRIYVDNTKVRLYKKGIMAKINEQIKETGSLEIKCLPKRIRNCKTKNIKITYKF